MQDSHALATLGVRPTNLFEGFPYLTTRVVPAMYHIIVLPDDVAEADLVDITRRQASANVLSTCLVRAANSALYVAPGGRENLAEPPGAASSSPVGSDRADRSPRRRRSLLGGWHCGVTSRRSRRVPDTCLAISRRVVGRRRSRRPSCWPAGNQTASPAGSSAARAAASGAAGASIRAPSSRVR